MQRLTRRSLASTSDVRQLAATVEQLVHAAPEAPVPPALGEIEAFVPERAFKWRRICACLAFRAIDVALRREAPDSVSASDEPTAKSP